MHAVCCAPFYVTHLQTYRWMGVEFAVYHMMMRMQPPNALTFAEFNMNNLCYWFERIDGSIVHDVKCALTVWLCNILHTETSNLIDACACVSVFVCTVGRSVEFKNGEHVSDANRVNPIRLGVSFILLLNRMTLCVVTLTQNLSSVNVCPHTQSQSPDGGRCDGSMCHVFRSVNSIKRQLCVCAFSSIKLNMTTVLKYVWKVSIWSRHIVHKDTTLWVITDTQTYVICAVILVMPYCATLAQY